MTAARLAATALIAVAVACATAPSSRADWSPAHVLSGTPSQQAVQADKSTISQDGRFAAFRATYAGTTGVWRTSLANGGLVLVAPESDMPSLSGDGRLVAFTTRVALDPVNDTNTLPDVYVRDMALPVDAPGAYTLASAHDGAATGLAYNGGSGATTVAGGGALSADGRSLAFAVLSVSDLAGPGTPSDQVVVRHLDTLHTELVSTAIDAATGEQTTAPAPRGAVVGLGVGPSVTISADGSTVAWLGRNLGDVTRVVPGEFAEIATGNDGSQYTEPLWRRLADGVAAPIRRIVGGGDPFNPACPPEGRTSSELEAVPLGRNPCDGPFAMSITLGYAPGSDPAPRLSADGLTAAVLVAAIPRDSAIRPPGSATANAFVVDMRPGLSRVAATRALTAWASTDFSNPFLAGSVHAIAVSPDATHVALATERGAFPLSPPLLVDAPPATLGTSILYDVDLTRGIMRRVSRSYTGGPPGGSGGFATGAASPSYSGDGRTLVFASDAPDLFYGDGNGTGDVLASTWADPPAGPGSPVQSLSPAPPARAPVPAPRLFATATSRPDGTVAVQATVPGAGRLTLTARAQVREVRTVRVRTRSRRTGRRVTRTRHVVRYVQRAIATKRVPVRAAGLATVSLVLAKSLAPQARTPRGLAASLTVSLPFAGRTLKTALPIVFRTRPKKATKKQPAAKSGPPTTRGPRR